MSRAFSLPEAIAFDRTLTQGDFSLFAKVSGDTNPLHLDPDAASAGPFGRTIAPEMLLYAILWGAIHQAVPDLVARRVTLSFPAPAFVDESLSVTITPQDMNGGVRFRLMRPDGAVCCEGQTRLGAQDDALIVSDDMALLTPATDTAPQVRVGARVRRDRKYSAADLADFAVVAGLEAANFGFLPEPMVAALFSGLLGTRMPGRSARTLKLQLEFVMSAPPYTPFVNAVELVALDKATGQATLRTLATLADGTILADGRALATSGDGAG